MNPRTEWFAGHSPALESGGSSFTVEELLALPIMAEARMVAGERGAGREVTRVNVLEMPDMAAWVQPGEFLVTAGYPFRDDPDRFRQLIPELFRRGVAALGIETKRFVDELPQEVVEEAQACGFPLLVLPPDTVFSDVVRAVMDRVLAEEVGRLADLQNRIQRMTRLLLEGNGLYSFLDALETMMGNPVVMIHDHDKRWLSASLRSVEPGEGGPAVQSLTFRQFGRGLSSGFLPIGGTQRAYVSPIPARKAKTAGLVLLERGRMISPLDALSMDRLAALAGLELANLEAVTEVEGKYLDPFLQDWLSGKIVSEADWKLRADVCGCSLPEGVPLIAVLVGWPEMPPSADKLRESARRLRSVKLRNVEGLLASPICGELALVVPVPAHTREDHMDGAELLLRQLLAELRPILEDKGLKLYAGRTAARSETLHKSWQQAIWTRQVAQVCGLGGDTLTYDRLGVYSMLYLIPFGEEREQFLRRYCYPLQQADRKRGGRLLETLEMFFHCNGNIKLTSEKLYAHYNTVVYRLEKIQHILGVSLDDPEDRLLLHLALKLGQITPAGPC